MAADADQLTVVPNTTSIQTRQKFGSVQLHLEWKAPDSSQDTAMNHGNSGVVLMGLYELQIYDSYLYIHKIYYNGQAGSIYKQHRPLKNVCLSPQTWQSYDIIFQAPIFNADKTLKTPAFMTVLHNHILILNHVELKGTAVYQGYPRYEYHEAQRPLQLQEHASRVSFRNIWIREL